MRTVKGVSVVSMSWGSSEFSGEAGYDKNFTTPAGHTGVTFVAAAGDNGADGGAQWPASSPNVLSVGGTSLSLNSNNTISSESTWQDTSGGTSSFESVPSYQSALNVGARTTSDVSYNADPNTGFATYDSLAYQGESGWMETGGTSAGTPQWAALIAIADQGRSVQGRTSLDGASGTLPALYNIYNNPTTYAADFNDITTGSNGFSFGGGNYGGNYGGNDWGGWGGPFGGFPFGGFPFGFPFTATAAVRTASSAATSTNTPSITSAAPGFDLPTGLGTPKAAGVIASLVSSGVSKSVKLKSSAKVAHSIKLHPAVAVPPPDAQPSAFVSQSAPLRPAAPFDGCGTIRGIVGQCDCRAPGRLCGLRYAVAQQCGPGVASDERLSHGHNQRPLDRADRRACHRIGGVDRRGRRKSAGERMDRARGDHGNRIDRAAVLQHHTHRRGRHVSGCGMHLRR